MLNRIVLFDSILSKKIILHNNNSLVSCQDRKQHILFARRVDKMYISHILSNAYCVCVVKFYLNDRNICSGKCRNAAVTHIILVI